MTVPRATYRLQLNKDFTFAHARDLVPYLADLGVSHAYLSPILKAQPGSTHGYDTVDHRQINPELGTLDDFRALAKALREREMGIVLDFVPNHMGVGGADNDLWLDVLRNGVRSQYADWFDIDWHPPRPGMDGKLLVPFLGTSFAEALAAGQLELRHGEDGFAVWAYDKEKLPIRPEDESDLLEAHGSAQAAIAAHAGKPDDPESWTALDALIGRQHWRLSHHAVAADEINYRRFFINSELAGIRVDRPEVFDHAHAVIFDLIGEGLIDGLRIDHVDGLLAPKTYLETLRAKSPREIYLSVEKILAPHEQLRSDWPIDGTTGYEIGTQLTRVLINAKAEDAVTKIYTDFAGAGLSQEEEEYRCKLRIMDNELAAELGSLSRALAKLAWTNPATGDLTELGLRRALRETISHMSVYRTYAGDGDGSDLDARETNLAIARARKSAPQIQPALLDFVANVLNGALGTGYDATQAATLQGRIQQYTGPAMAKGLEDTALYRLNRLIALNEVGAHPDRFAVGIEAFHASNAQRLKTHPHCMVATSTHDTKRGEDNRAIVAAIADAPALWSEAVLTWPDLLAESGSADIDRNDLYLIFQLLLGGWPLGGDHTGFADRLKAAMMKSVREARLRSDWAVNNTAYENQLDSFIDAMLGDEAFLAKFRSTHAGLAEIGKRKGLIQAALKLTIPGVPDTYRGAEDWEQSFVDPDNRRVIDFSQLNQRLASPQPGPDDKLILTQAMLQLRKRLPQLFAEGTYEPLAFGKETLGFLRQHEQDTVVVAADLSAGHAKGVSEQHLADFANRLKRHFGAYGGPVVVLST